MKHYFSKVFFFILFTLSGCIDPLPPEIKEAVKILDDGIRRIDQNSQEWQTVLETTRDKLIRESQSTIRNDVSRVLDQATSEIGIEAKCYSDFLRDRVKEDLRRIKAKLTQDKIILNPVFCNATPNVVDFSLVREGSLNVITIPGYNLDQKNIEVFLRDNQGKETDVTEKLANPNKYLLTLNLGGNGVPLSPSSDQLIFKLPGNQTRSINVVQPRVSALKLKVFSKTSNVASHPNTEIVVEEGYKIIGGGARVNWTGAGNLLTASYPESPQKWLAKSKDHEISNPSTINVWAIAIYDPENQWDVKIFNKTSPTASHPASSVKVPDDYIMVGGGARVNWTGAGNLLTASYPLGKDTWEARSKDHNAPSPATITAYAIGIKPKQGNNYPEIKIFSSESLPGQHLKYLVKVEPDYLLLSGGALVDWTGAGNLLTASYPSSENTWEARSKDHNNPSSATIKVYAIGLKK